MEGWLPTVLQKQVLYLAPLRPSCHPQILTGLSSRSKDLLFPEVTKGLQD